MPKLNKQIQHFANILDLLYKGKLNSQTNRTQFVKTGQFERKCSGVTNIVFYKYK